MKIFVSHKKEDAGRAALVASTLRLAGHEVYIDLIDNDFKRGTTDLAEHLLNRLDSCNSLIAVISTSTKDSWWVPWEIGVATEKDFPLSSFISDGTTPPEYLMKWPILRTVGNLELFARKVKDVEPRVSRLAQTKSFSDAKHASADEFHRDLKQALGQ